MAHCIAWDCVMGAGIAPQFADVHFKGIREFCVKSNKFIGKALLYEPDGKNPVFNLITKRLSRFKPLSIDGLKWALQDMKRQIIEKDYKQIAMPRIGSGRDGFDWNEVKSVIHEVFDDLDVEVRICIWS